MAKIIGLNSQRGKSGKDTLCDLLGDRAIRFAFGDALKEACAKVIAVTPLYRQHLLEDMHDQSRKDKPVSLLRINDLPESEYKQWLITCTDFDKFVLRTPRFHLQQYGNGFIRDYKGQPNKWLNSVKNQVEVLQTDKEFIVITDVRQPNEYDWIRANGGLVVEIKRDWILPEVDNQPLHITDTALSDLNLPVITNEWDFKASMFYQLFKLMEVSNENNN